MSQRLLFDDDAPEQAARLRPRLRELAAEGVYFGTSSWKYEGWLGSIYSPDRYMYRGKFAKTKFEAECLEEYAETFPVVCGDFTFYQFPSAPTWKKLFDSSPESLKFAFKVPEDITVSTWPGHARYGSRAGQENKGFLDPDLFGIAFARPLVRYRDRVATLIFEFGTLPKRTFVDVNAFLERLDPFLSKLPGGFRYAIEIRNPEYLGPAYFAALARYNVAHVFNAWTRMPDLPDQIAMPGAFTADFTVARALLHRGQGYADAVDTFEPYKHVQKPYPPAREGLRMLVDRARKLHQPAFLFVNNRLEGNSPGTIEAVIADS